MLLSFVHVTCCWSSLIGHDAIVIDHEPLVMLWHSQLAPRKQYLKPLRRALRADTSGLEQQLDLLRAF